MDTMMNAYEEMAIRLLRRAILLTLMGEYTHAAGQLAAARGNLVLATMASS